MSRLKINALRRATLLTMSKANMPRVKVGRAQSQLNTCLEGGTMMDFGRALALVKALPRGLHQPIVGRYVAILKEMQADNDR